MDGAITHLRRFMQVWMIEPTVILQKIVIGEYTLFPSPSYPFLNGGFPRHWRSEVELLGTT